MDRQSANTDVQTRLQGRTRETFEPASLRKRCQVDLLLCGAGLGCGVLDTLDRIVAFKTIEEVIIIQACRCGSTTPTTVFVARVNGMCEALSCLNSSINLPVSCWNIYRRFTTMHTLT